MINRTVMIPSTYSVLMLEECGDSTICELDGLTGTRDDR
jgi:hypothetical protein